MLSTTQKTLIILGALFGLLGVAAGAFGAHALKQKLQSEMLSVFEVGVKYQMYHALAICIAVWISTLSQGNYGITAGWLFVIGVILFSGSLYVLSLTGIRAFGAITPIGGLFFLAGWATLIIAIYKIPSV